MLHRLRILSLCDKTGTMVRPWLAAGHEAVIVDLQHPPGAHTEGPLTRIGADLRTWRPPPLMRWDAVFAFPPCTDLASSGARWWARKGPAALRSALGLVARTRRLIHLSGASCWFIENPVGRLSTHWRRPNYAFDPCDYGGYLSPPGDMYSKKTCLWAGSAFIMPPPRPVLCLEGSKMHRLPPGPERQNLRSATPNGFALAVFVANEPHLIASLRRDMGEAAA